MQQRLVARSTLVKFSSPSFLDLDDINISRETPTSAEHSVTTRKAFIQSLLFTTLLAEPSIANAAISEVSNTKNSIQEESTKTFSSAFGREEYTNSITASRDTNISPKEVYDSIQSSYIRYPIDQLKLLNQNVSEQQKGQNHQRIPKALDVGCGAGVSTQYLFAMGYKAIDAIDWSSKAWDENVNPDDVPDGVTFYPMDDERFLNNVWRPRGKSKLSDGNKSIVNQNEDKFDAIVFNFAINESKAEAYAQELLQPDVGRLLAPVNVQSDYWLKQAFKVYDAKGNVLWTANDVGAWSVQFQPDVTQDTCQGIWCAPFNGFQKQRR